MRSSPLFVAVATALIFVAFAAFAHASKESVSCFYFAGRNYTSAGVIRTEVSVSAYGCCKLCDDTAGCAAATYISKTYKCVMVADNSQFTDNVQGLVGVQNKDLTPPPTPQPTQPLSTPQPPTLPPANGNIGVLTCCLTSNCSVFADRTCTSYGSECGKCVNGIPYDQEDQVYYCPRYVAPNAPYKIKSYRYDCTDSANLKIEVFSQPNCQIAESIVKTPYSSCSANKEVGFAQASVIKGPPSSAPFIDQENCYGMDSMCENKCHVNRFLPGDCTYASWGQGPNDGGQHLIAQFYRASKQVTYATYGDDDTCQNSTHAMFVEPEGACFKAYEGYSHRNDADGQLGKKKKK